MTEWFGVSHVRRIIGGGTDDTQPTKQATASNRTLGSFGILIIMVAL